MPRKNRDETQLGKGNWYSFLIN